MACLGFVPGYALIAGCGNVECLENDPVCNQELFLLQLLNRSKTSRLVATHLYTADTGGLNAFAIDNAGTLTKTSGPTALGTISSISIAPAWNRLYLTSSAGSPGVHNFSLDAPDTPALLEPTLLAGSVMAHSAVSPDGKYVYASTSTTIHGFSVQSSGTLGTISGSPFGSGCMSSLGVDGQSRFLIWNDGLAAQPLKTFAINSGTGALTDTGLAVNPTATITRMRFDAEGDFLLGVTTTVTDKNLFAYKIGSTGSLTPGSNTFFTVGPGNVTLTAVAITPDRKFVYAPNSTTDTIAAYSLDTSTGGFTALPTAPFGTDNGPSAAAMSPDGRFLFVSADNSQGTFGVITYKINADGSLTRGETMTGFSTTPTGMQVRARTVEE